MRLIRKLALLTVLFAPTLKALPFPHPNQIGFFVDLGLEGYYYHYRETDQNVFIMQHSGPLYGINYSIGYQPACTDFRFGIEGRNAFGNHLHYESRKSGSMKHVDYTVSEVRLLGSYPWCLKNHWTIEGYTGFGWRYLFDHGYNSISSTGHWGYDRTSQYNYLPVGIRIIKTLHKVQKFDTVELAAYLEWDAFLGGMQKSYLFWEPIKKQQHKGVGYRMGLDLQIPCNRIAFQAGIFARFWNIGESDKVLKEEYIWWEPKNKTSEIGLRVGVAFY